MKIKPKIIFAAVATTLAFSSLAQAETLTDFFQQSKIDGQLRSYYFSRDYGASNVPNQNAFTVGGILNVQTAPFLGGFGVGASFFTANSLGTHGGNTATVDTTLMGINSSINALGQAYIQYAIPKMLLVRAGDQEINTPWLNGSDSRILPATYQGIYAEFSPIAAVKLYGLREFRWKSRTSGDYFKDNLYYKTGYDGDPLYGGSGSLPTSDGQAQGTLAFGASANADGAKAQIWYYDFYQFSNMLYGDASYTLKTGLGINPLVGAQFMREWNSNSLLNSSLGASAVNGVQGNGVNSTVWGVQAGFDYEILPSFLGQGQLTWSYNAILAHAGNIGGGAIVSPYTVGYATDPLYTTSMIRGLVEMGPGNGWKVKWTQNLLNKQFLLMAAFARYHTYYKGNSNDAYVDLTYFPGGMLKGFSVRDRMEVANGGFASSPLNPGDKPFVYNRVMLTYAF